MNLHLFVMIIIWAFVVVFSIALFLLIFLIGRWTVKDNPTKAFIFIKTGNHISSPIKAKLMGKPSKLGSRWKYGKYGKNVIFLPASYKDYYHKNRRAIYINRIGQLIASPFDDDQPLTDDEKNELIYELVTSHIGADGMRALKGKGNLSILFVIIIVVVIMAVGIFGYNYYTKNMAQQQQPATQQQQPAQKPAIEIKPQGE